MQANSRVIVSNQVGVHPDLNELVLKHHSVNYQQPFRPFSQEIFYEVNTVYKQNKKPLILDSGCGNGSSTFNIALKYPDSLVIGIDKSEFRLHARLQKNSLYQQDNVILVRADLIDFWRLAEAANWQIAKHYLLYPNPWPKKKHIQRRWYGHPVFPTLLNLGGELLCRSNWQLYIQELAVALATLGYQSSEQPLEKIDNISPFETKYHQSKHPLFQLTSYLSNKTG